MTLDLMATTAVAAILLTTPSVTSPSPVRASHACYVDDVCHSDCVPRRDCSLPVDNRNCTIKLFGSIFSDDPACEAAKQVQNQVYAVQKGACEASKADEHAQCEVRKSTCNTVASACNAVFKGAADPNLEGKRILWVDDKPDNNTYERQVLAEFGAEVSLATNTGEALQQIQTTPYAIVISNLSRNDDPKAGYTLLAQLSKQRNYPPYIIYTGSTTPKYVQEAKRKGAFGETSTAKELFELIVAAIKKH
ncbi:response regulator [Paraburkholderia sp. MM5477-R1]|uniref:response regulator n=1 Tax=Paraburkholderia sp. MM5477-R1 TaxID=2991062 RepID=UPI003D222A1E